MPGEADWLIWERDGEKSRLCKMHDGKWSVVRDAPCAYVPGVIVVNNDENIVFLSFSLKFDDGDVDASLRRAVTHLREHGALHLNRLKVPVPDPDEGLSEFEKSCREDAAGQARLIEESRRRNAEELARLDAERAAANHEASRHLRREDRQVCHRRRCFLRHSRIDIPITLRNAFMRYVEELNPHFEAMLIMGYSVFFSNLQTCCMR